MVESTDKLFIIQLTVHKAPHHPPGIHIVLGKLCRYIREGEFYVGHNFLLVKGDLGIRYFVALVVIWVFCTRTATRAWLGVTAVTAVTAVLAWLIQVLGGGQG